MPDRVRVRHVLRRPFLELLFQLFLQLFEHLLLKMPGTHGHTKKHKEQESPSAHQTARAYFDATQKVRGHKASRCITAGNGRE